MRWKLTLITEKGSYLRVLLASKLQASAVAPPPCQTLDSQSLGTPGHVQVGPEWTLQGGPLLRMRAARQASFPLKAGLTPPTTCQFPEVQLYFILNGFAYFQFQSINFLLQFFFFQQKF